jgi:hypothetical protein
MMTPTISRGFPASVRGDPVLACRFGDGFEKENRGRLVVIKDMHDEP